MSGARSIDPLELPLSVQWRPTPLLWRFHYPRDRKVDKSAVIGARLSGNCLRPYLLEGDGVFFDMKMSPISGDLVMAEMRYESGRGSGLTYLGGAPGVTTRRSVKQLQIDDLGRRWLVCADGRVAIDNHRILGVLIATARPPLFSLRRWRFPMRLVSWPAGVSRDN